MTVVVGLADVQPAEFAQRPRPYEQNLSPIVQKAIADAAAKHHIPGIAVAVVGRGRITGLYRFGVTDQQSHSPVTSKTIFEAGSLGETVFAYAVLQLVAQGKLDLGIPLTQYLQLPYMRDMDALAASDRTEPIYDPRLNQVNTVRVLSHTAGFPDWARNEHFLLRSTPSQEWLPSNEDDIYLQHVIEHITGQSAEDFLATSILDPAGMRHSSFTWSEENAPLVSEGYDSAGNPLPPDRFTRPAPGTTLYTTIEDYGRFLAILLASAPAQRIHESTVSLMLSSTVSIDKPNSLFWGLGIGLEKRAGDEFFFQRGVNPGFQSFFIASRTAGTGIVILTNSSNGLNAVPEIVVAALGEDHPVLKSSFLHPQ